MLSLRVAALACGLFAAAAFAASPATTLVEKKCGVSSNCSAGCASATYALAQCNFVAALNGSFYPTCAGGVLERRLYASADCSGRFNQVKSQVGRCFFAMIPNNYEIFQCY
jgi:hypothetical protein